MTTLAMTLRFHGAGLVFGLAFILTGLYGVHIYEPIPASLGVSTPLPYDWIFAGAAVLGLVMVIRALLKGRGLAR